MRPSRPRSKNSVASANRCREMKCDFCEAALLYEMARNRLLGEMATDCSCDPLSLHVTRCCTSLDNLGGDAECGSHASLLHMRRL